MLSLFCRRYPGRNTIHSLASCGGRFFHVLGERECRVAEGALVVCDPHHIKDKAVKNSSGVNGVFQIQNDALRFQNTAEVNFGSIDR